MEFLFEILGEILTCFWIGDGKQADTEKGCVLLFAVLIVFVMVILVIFKIFYGD